MLQQALINQIGKHKEGDNLLLQALACLVLWTLGGKKKKMPMDEEKEYTLDDAMTETFSRRATGSSGGSKGVIPYVS